MSGLNRAIRGLAHHTNLEFEEKKTSGEAYLTLDTIDKARKVAIFFEGYKMDKNHVLKTNLMADYERIINTDQEYAEPKHEEFKEQENLMAWLLDVEARTGGELLQGAALLPDEDLLLALPLPNPNPI